MICLSAISWMCNVIQGFSSGATLPALVRCFVILLLRASVGAGGMKVGREARAVRTAVRAPWLPHHMKMVIMREWKSEVRKEGQGGGEGVDKGSSAASVSSSAELVMLAFFFGELVAADTPYFETSSVQIHDLMRSMGK